MPLKKPTAPAPTRRAVPASKRAKARPEAPAINLAPAGIVSRSTPKRPLPKAVQAVLARKSMPRAIGPQIIEEIFSRFHKAMPEPKGELEYVNAFTLLVATHIFRLANRLKLAPGKTPEQVEAGLEKRVPKHFRLHAHHWLILHGRYTCKALRPECERCVVSDLCTSADKRVP